MSKGNATAQELTSTISAESILIIRGIQLDSDAIAREA